MSYPPYNSDNNNSSSSSTGDSGNGSGEIHERTIKMWADQLRRQAISAYGEREFAKLMLSFARKIPPGGLDQDRLLDALDILIQAKDVKEMQLSIIWLDGEGYGDSTTTLLFDQIDLLRAARQARQNTQE